MYKNITVTTTVQADAKKVWDYYTNPLHIVKWNFADPSWHCPKAESELKVGGKYLARMETKDGSFGFDFEAIYTEIIHEKEFTYEFGGRKATVKFDALGKQTNVTVVFDAETEHPIDMQRDGWQAILENFKAYTETN